ncbi:MAG: glycosyltransferase [Chitinispirillaceae bacterium]|nr:glycosyltransferase [Chitinispirillaceae bacterium]
MVIGWIYPHREKCGIARYSLDYAEALETIATVHRIDPEWLFTDRKRFRETLRECTIAHLQYDTTAFMHGSTDFYRKLVLRIPVPLIVSLHEVYDENPFIFPRSALHGNPLSLFLKHILWNHTHPVDKAFLNHLAGKFNASHLLVHHLHHREILIGKGIDGNRISIFPMPMHRIQPPQPLDVASDGCLHLGAHGFIQSAYDFELLFAVLRKLQLPWRFTWIGGTRTDDNKPLHVELIRRIDELGWNDRFTITGWITEKELGDRLAGIDLILALFRHRSSSASIARALSHGKPVIANELPLTMEIADGNRHSHRSTAAPLLTTPAEPSAITDRIMEFNSNGNVRLRLYEGINAYVENHSFEKMARRLLDLYRGQLSR